jgi:Zn-dependent protease with chaperone function
LTLPIPFLAGLLLVLANRELLPAVPGSGTLARWLPFALLLAVPGLLALVAGRTARASLVSGRRPLVPARALLRLSALATPLVVHLLFAAGHFGDRVDAWAWNSELGRVALAVLPVYVAELPRLWWSTPAQLACEIGDHLAGPGPIDPELLPRGRELANVVRSRIGWPLLVAMPLALLGGALDLLQLHRETYVFVLVTSPGVAIFTVVLLALAVCVLPPWFRVTFAVRPLPEPCGTRMREVARALGFPPSRVLMLPTGMRSLNAMLVGPLPVGRCLCLTDGLVRELDVDSLAGVVAHEVGHAKMGHPALLIAMVGILPLAALVPVRLLDLDHVEWSLQVAFAFGAFAVLWYLVRTLAHRFEHEADVASVQALGAGPVTRALMAVTRLAMPVPHAFFGRLLSLHPDESNRWRTMRRYENEPEFRAAFDRQGRAWRRAIVASLVVATAAAAWVWWGDWAFERVVWRLHAGDHFAARTLAAGVADVPVHQQRAWKLVREELDVATDLAPDARDWTTARAALAGAAWLRGEAVLLASGPAAARPWLALGIGATSAPADLQRALHAYCNAAADDDPDRMREIAHVVRDLGVPPHLLPIFGE